MAELRIPKLNAADTRLAEQVFEFVLFLLDDDAHLTPTGNLTSAARQKLRARVQELMAADSSRDDFAAKSTDEESAEVQVQP